MSISIRASEQPARAASQPASQQGDLARIHAANFAGASAQSRPERFSHLLSIRSVFLGIRCARELAAKFDGTTPQAKPPFYHDSSQEQLMR